MLDNVSSISSLVASLLDPGHDHGLAIPFSRYLAWIMDGHYRAPRWLSWIERRVDTGPQSWKQYAVSMLLFNTLMFAFGFAVLSLQPLMPLNPDGKGMLAPTTMFNSVMSFLTNTNLQHYSGEQHLSYFSQLFFVCWNMFLSASVGFCGLAAIIRAFAATRTWATTTSTCGGSAPIRSCPRASSWACCCWPMASP